MIPPYHDQIILLIQLDVHLDGSVVQLRLHVNVFSLLVALEVDGQSSVLADIARHRNDLADELHLIRSLDGSQSDF